MFTTDKKIFRLRMLTAYSRKSVPSPMDTRASGEILLSSRRRFNFNSLQKERYKLIGTLSKPKKKKKKFRAGCQQSSYLKFASAPLSIRLILVALHFADRTKLATLEASIKFKGLFPFLWSPLSNHYWGSGALYN